MSVGGSKMESGSMSALSGILTEDTDDMPLSERPEVKKASKKPAKQEPDPDAEKQLFNCCIEKCPTTPSTLAALFHSFPENPKAKIYWVGFIRRSNGNSLRMTGNERLCSKHFGVNAFLQSGKLNIVARPSRLPRVAKAKLPVKAETPQNLTMCDYARFHYGGTILPDEELLDRLAPDRLKSIFHEINAFNSRHPQPQQWQLKWHVKPLQHSIERRKSLMSGTTDEEMLLYQLACQHADVLVNNGKKFGGSFDLTECPPGCSFSSECIQRHRSCLRSLLVITDRPKPNDVATNCSHKCIQFVTYEDFINIILVNVKLKCCQ